MPLLDRLPDNIVPKEIQQWQAGGQVCTARFSPCGNYLIAGGFDGRVLRWQFANDQLDERPSVACHHGWVSEVAFGPGGNRVVSADSWGRIACWDYASDSGEIAWSVDAAHSGWIYSVAVSPDGSRVATCGADGAVRLWSFADGELQQTLLGHGQPVFRVAFTPDSAHLVSGDLYGKLRHWDVSNGRELRAFDASSLYLEHRLQEVGGVRALAIAPDSVVLACGGTVPANGGNVQGTPTILLFDLLTGELRQQIGVGKNSEVYVTDLQFHPDGFLMATISGNPGTGKFVFLRPGDEAPMYEAAKLSNCHSISLHPHTPRIAIALTNAGSNGNGRRLDKNGEYAGNHSPIKLYDLSSPNT